MLAPQLTETEKQTMMTEVFLGYNHNLELADGEFTTWRICRRTSTHCSRRGQGGGRRKRSMACRGSWRRMHCAGCRIRCFDINGASMESYMPSVSIKAGEKQLVSMGAYLCIFPDGIYFNTEKYSDNGYMGQENVIDAESENVEISLCLADGSALTVSYAQAAQPESPSNGQYWLDTSGKLHTLKQWAEASGGSGYPCLRYI